MFKQKIARVVLCMVVMIAGVVGASAQTTQGGIAGTVRDEKGADISGAKITVTNEATGLQREMATEGNGIFRAMALPSGKYEVRAEAPGFSTASVKAVEVGVDQIRTIDVVLRVGARAEVIEVQSDAALTQTET
jgi:hypothetical protein